MPYVNNLGVKIYYEAEGEGTPLMLAHGASGSLEGWRSYGYVNALKENYQLILFDARGHGKSDKPHNVNSYRYNVMASDAVAVLDELKTQKAHYFGYSMGAGVGFRAATAFPDRFFSFILGGQSPYQEEGEAKARQRVLDSFYLMARDPDAYVALRERPLGRPMRPEEKAQLLDNDAEALVAAIKAFQEAAALSNSELAGISAPCLIYCGDRDLRHDGANKCVSYLPNAEFVSLPGLDHARGQAEIDQVLPHLKKFLAEVEDGTLPSSWREGEANDGTHTLNRF